MEETEKTLEGVTALETGKQLYTVTAQLCEGEAPGQVRHVTESNGWEAWRMIARRFDLQGAGRRRSIMSQLLQPGSFGVKELNSAVANWGEKVRIYERRTGRPLPDDIKAPVLTEMAQGNPKEHLILNASKLKTYASVREEIQCFLGSKQNQDVIPMDVGALGKDGKAKGKGKRSDDRDVCVNCGKRGHWKRMAERREEALPALPAKAERQQGHYWRGQEGVLRGLLPIMPEVGPQGGLLPQAHRKGRPVGACTASM